MSVRATDRLIGDLVIVSDLPKSPHMVVKAVNKETDIITTVWFCDENSFQEGTFPAKALDRAAPKTAPAAKPQTGKAQKPSKPTVKKK